MGNGHPKANTAQAYDIDDTVLEMRMQAKSMERVSKKSDKEAQQQVKKARDALKKGNEEGAKLYLQNASMKTREAQNVMRTAHRLESVTTQIKANENNVMLTNQLKKLTPLLQQQSNLNNVANVNQTMNDYQSAMDNLLIAGNIMNDQMSTGMMDPTVDANVENMMTMLKQEINNDLKKDFMGINQNFQYQNVPSEQNAYARQQKSYNM